MSKPAIHIENLSKSYKLGEYSGKTFADEFKRLFKPAKQIEIGTNNRAEVNVNDTHVWALKDLNFTLHQGEVVGVIGKNGAGKSTLLKLLSRITSPSTGTININGRIGALLEVGTGFQPDLTGRENVYLNGAILGMSKKEIDAKLQDIITFSGCAKYIDTPVKRYSSGMMVRLGFSVAAHLEPEILIIDEVLAVGDQDFQDQCVKKMKEFAAKGKTVLFVSHNMASVKSLCSRGIVLEQGTISFDGEIDDAIKYYLDRQEKGSEDGKIPEGAGTINKSVINFKKIMVKGAEKQHQNSLHYGENLRIECEIEAKESQEVNVEFLLNSSDNYVLGGFNNVFSNQTIMLQKGINKFEVSVETPLNPGKYSLSPSIAQTNGISLHFLPNYIDLVVENVPLNKENPYPFVWINGNVQFKSKWIKK